MVTKREVMIKVCSAPNLIDAFNIFEANKILLHDCKFIFTSDVKTNIPEYTRQRFFKNGAGIFNLFLSEKIIVLDINVFEGMKNGNATYSIDYSVSLDTQAVSYLKPFLNNQEHKLPKDFAEIFEFLALREVNIDPMPYMIENIHNVKNPLNIDSIFEILKSYEILKNIDHEELKKNGIIKSKISLKEINENAKLSIKNMMEFGNDQDILNSIDEVYEFRYCLLLKMSEIQLHNSHKDSLLKLKQFLDFCQNEISVLPLREIVIANEFFKKGQNLTFFGKVQKRNKKLIVEIKNMAWDIYHISNMEKSISRISGDKASYFLPAFLTFDKRLIEILGLYHIKSFGFSENNEEIIPGFDANNFLKEIEGNLEIKYYFSEKAKDIREKGRTRNIDIKDLIFSIEESIKKFM